VEIDRDGGEGAHLEEFLELPEEKPALEYVDGEVTQKASPQGKHSVLQSEIALRIGNFARPARLAIVMIELRSIFARACVVPDVSVYLSPRVPLDPTGKIADRFFDPPDLAVEIVSPDQSTNAPVRRCLWYVANGVQLALLVDPDDESVLLFRPSQVPVALRAGDRIDLDEVLPGFELTAATLFEALRVT
jgi:Uma2 family endonuclease